VRCCEAFTVPKADNGDAMTSDSSLDLLALLRIVYGAPGADTERLVELVSAREPGAAERWRTARTLDFTTRGAYRAERVPGAEPPTWQTADGRWRVRRTYLGPQKRKNEECDYELLYSEDGQHYKYVRHARVSDEALHQAALLDGHDISYEYK